MIAEIVATLGPWNWWILALLLIAVVRMPKSSVISFALPFIGLYLAHLAFSTVRLSALMRRPKP